MVGRLGDDRDAAIGGGDDGAVAVVEEEVRPARRVQRRVRARGRRHEWELEEGQRVQRDRVEEVEGRALVEVRAGPLQPAPTVEGQGDAGAAELGRERPRPAPERPPVLRVGVRLPRVVVDAVARVARHERVRPGRAHAGEPPGRGGVADEPGRRGRRARRRDRVRRLHLRAGRDGGERGEQQERHDGGGDGSHGRHRASLATAATTPGRPRFGRPYTGRSPRRAVRGGAGGGSMDGCATRRPRERRRRPGGAAGPLLHRRRRRAAGLCRPRPRTAARAGGDLVDPPGPRLGEPGVAPLARRARARATRSSATTSAGAGSRTASSASSRSTRGWPTSRAWSTPRASDRFALLGVSQGGGGGGRATRRGIPSGSPTSCSTGAMRAAGRCAAPRSARGGGDALGDPRRLDGCRPDVPAPVQHAVPPARHRPSRWRGTTRLQRRSTSAETAVRLYEARGRIDVRRAARAGDDPDARACTRATTGWSGRGGQAARRPDPGRPAGPAGVGEPHPAVRRAGVARSSCRSSRLPRHGAGGRPTAVTRSSARASWRSSSSWRPG